VRLSLPMPDVTRRVQRTRRAFTSMASVLSTVATARPFFAAISLNTMGDVGVLTVQYPEEEENQLGIVQDLFDTLVIDQDETSYLRAPPLPRWRLLRLDDNCNTSQGVDVHWLRKGSSRTRSLRIQVAQAELLARRNGSEGVETNLHVTNDFGIRGSARQ
jgi:hypothetical protein